MKKLFTSISGLFIYLYLALPAFAATPITIDPCASASRPNDIANVFCRLGQNVGETIRGIVVFFVILAVVIALLYLLYGGVKWITSRGDKTEVESARNHIIAAIIGLIVVFLAVFILTIILAAFGLGFENLKIPVIGKPADGTAT